MAQQDDREKDVLTKEDFNKLEASESKKSIFKRIFGKKEEKKTEKKKENDYVAPISFNEMINEFYNLNERFDNLLVQVEKQAGRIEMVEESKKAFDEKLVGITTQMGELRSNLVSRERFFDRMESEFTSMKQIVSKAKPEILDIRFKQINNYLHKLYDSLNHFQTKMNERGAYLNELNSQLSELHKVRSEVTSLREEMEKISVVKETKKYVDQKAGEIEKLYSNIVDKFSTMEKSIDRVKSLEDSFNNMKKSVDRLKLLPKIVATKKEMDTLYSFIETLKSDVDLDLSKVKISPEVSIDAGKEMDALIAWAKSEISAGKNESVIVSMAVSKGWKEDLVRQAIKLVRE